jgi:type VI secretion system secreted protein VgrG
MPTLTQEKRLLRVNTPVGRDAFMALELEGEESSSELFQFQVLLASADFDIGPSDMVGQKVTVSVHYNTKYPRYINGIVSQFHANGVEDGLRSYSITIVPTMWLLTLSQASVMYAGKTTKDIVSGILKAAGVDFKYNASINDKREYCIQYQETDFEFVSRLLAEEGLSYYFSHADGKHELIILDKNTQYDDCDENSVECDEENFGTSSLESRVMQWQRKYQMHSGKVAASGYLESAAGKGKSVVVSTNNKTLKLTKYQRDFHENAVPYLMKDELPDYGAKITQKKTAELIIETEEAGYDIANGISNCCTFMAGGRFELKHRLKSESGKYLITRVSHKAYANSEGSDYTNSFSCVPSTVPVHPSPPGNRVRINGPHLAKVVEVKAGDSAGATDPQLMVKLCFFWDEKQTSCWVRVMQNFAGKNQGAVFVPRVGSEVVVEFVGGDPDRPLVVGAVFNSENKAPQYSLTQSGFKTGDDKKAFNELRFDDKKGKEEVYFQAGKDLNHIVLNDEVGEVGNDQTLTVLNDQALDVGNDQTEAVKNDQKLDVGNNQTLSVGSDQTIDVGSNHKLDVGSNQTLSIGGNQTFDVTGNHTVKGKAVTIEAKTSITLKVGANKIVIDNSGITIKGTTVKANASATMELKGSASAKLEGGGMLDVKASGILNIKGSMTKIN